MEKLGWVIWLIFAASVIIGLLSGTIVGIIITRRVYSRKFRCYYEDWVKAFTNPHKKGRDKDI